MWTESQYNSEKQRMKEQRMNERMSREKKVKAAKKYFQEKNMLQV